VLVFVGLLEDMGVAFPSNVSRRWWVGQLSWSAVKFAVQQILPTRGIFYTVQLFAVQ